MRKMITGIALGAFLVAVPTYMTRGQAKNEMTQVKTPKVEQGKLLSMDVSVDKAANVDADVYVDATPEGPPSEVQLNCHLSEGQTKCTAARNLAVDAKLGRWVISRITFAPVGGGGQVQLAKHGDTSFEVVPGVKIVSPDSATISGIK